MASNPGIMIVDDEFLSAMALGDHLEQNGFDVVGPFSNAQDALSAEKLDQTKAAFLDINLGEGLTSEEVAKELQERGIPYVFLTGYSEIPPPLQEFQRATFISKPITLERALSEAKRMTAAAP